VKYSLTFNVWRYTLPRVPIRSFACSDTEAIFEGKQPRRFRSIAEVAQRKLQMLDDAVQLRDLASPPGNRLEPLSGRRKGQLSIRINDQWRVCFKWTKTGPENVEIVDYH
jgi:toxin HigB-1